MPTRPDQFPHDDLAAKMATATVQVVFGFRRSATDWAFERLPLRGELQEDFRKLAEAAAIDLGDNRAPRAYDPEWQLSSDEYLYLENEPPAGGNFFEKLEGFAALPEYRPAARARKPKVWVIVAQLDDDSLAYFGTRIIRSAVLDRGSPALRLIYGDGAFDSLDETVITLRPETDFIAWQGVMIVLNSTNFHSLFRDIPALIERVDAHLEEITRHVAIAHLDEMAVRIKATPSMAVKLLRIIERADMHTRGPADLRKYGQEYGIDVEWDGDEMVWDGSVEKQWNILRLLDEARTLGPVTGKHWESGTKVEV